MKLRIKGNSLRYRLTRREVERLSETGVVEEKITFGDSVFSYALCTTESSALSATFCENRITVYLPSVFANEWVQSDKVGFDHRLSLNGTEEPLYLLVEKDFTCLDNVEEDQSDNYPNPLSKNSL